MPQLLKNILCVLAGTVTLLAIYLAMKYVVPEVFSWIKYLLAILFPFLLAVLFSIFLEPVIIFLTRDGKVPKIFAVPVAMFIFFGGIGTILTLIILRLVKELNDLSEELPEKLDEGQQFIDLWFEKGKIFYGTLPEEVTANLEATIDNIVMTIQGWLPEIAGFLLVIIGGVPGVIMVVIVSLIATYFLSKDREEIIKLWLKLVPSPWGERALQISRQVTDAFQSYVRAQFVLISITTVISITGLHIIGSQYALTLGLIIGVLDMIPVLGPGTIYIPWAFWAFITGDMVLGLKLTVLYLLVLVVRTVLEAKVVAVNLGLHPLAVLAAMYIGLKTIGILGLILGPILVIAIQAAVKAGFSVHK